MAVEQKVRDVLNPWCCRRQHGRGGSRASAFVVTPQYFGLSSIGARAPNSTVTTAIIIPCRHNPVAFRIRSQHRAWILKLVSAHSQEYDTVRTE